MSVKWVNGVENGNSCLLSVPKRAGKCQMEVGGGVSEEEKVDHHILHG